MRSELERYDSLEDALKRFKELFPLRYNQESVPNDQIPGMSFARLTLGVDWKAAGKETFNSVDLIQVRNEKVVLADDFTEMDELNTDRQFLSSLRMMEHELGFDTVLCDGNRFTRTPFRLWENDYFEPIGPEEAILEAPSQWSYVIVTLQPDLTVDYEIYDNATAELKGSGKLLRTDFISMEDAARAALGQPDLNMTRCEMTVRDTLLEAHEEFPKKRAEPVYLKTWEQAVQMGEQKLYNKSRSLNEEFLSDMTSEISRTYNGRSFDSSVSRYLLAKYGAQRSSVLLANVIQHRP